MKKLFLLATLSALLACLAAGNPAWAETPFNGVAGSLYAIGGPDSPITVAVTKLGEAGWFSEFFYVYAGQAYTGTQVVFGDNKTLLPSRTLPLSGEGAKWTAGQEVILGVNVYKGGKNTAKDYTWFSGDPARNSDGKWHATIDWNGDPFWGDPVLVGFEDTSVGGDWDYNDAVIMQVTGVTSVPEIPAAMLCPLGLAALGLIRRRFAK